MNEQSICMILGSHKQISLKDGSAHSNMNINHFQFIDLNFWNAFCEDLPWGSFLFTLLRQKKVCTLGMRLLWTYVRNYFLVYIYIPFNVTLFVISPKLQRIWRWNFGFAIWKIWAFNLISNNIILPVEPWGMRMWSA